MPSKYEVVFSRNETTIYIVKVEANSEKDAEKKARKLYDQGYWNREEIVYGEEQTHEINYIGELENA
jgi:hypothetical protein